MHQPAFEACVKAGVVSVMCSYNEINGVPSCASHELLTTILRKTWNFSQPYNFVVGDCGAVNNIAAQHHYNATPEAGATQALMAGVDWDCYGTKTPGGELAYTAAVQSGLLNVSVLDNALTRVLTAHVRLGFFDPPSAVSYKRLGPDTIDAPTHRALARWAASRVVVLLQNRGRVLPLGNLSDAIGDKHIALVGPNADNLNALWGDYAGKASLFALCYHNILCISLLVY